MSSSASWQTPIPASFWSHRPSVLIAEAGLAIPVDALVEDDVTTTYDNPTLPETLMEAAADEFDRAIHG